MCFRDCKGFQGTPGGVTGYLQVSEAFQRVSEILRVPLGLREATGGLRGSQWHFRGSQGDLRGYLEVSRAIQKVSWVTWNSEAFQGVPGVSRRFYGRIKASQSVTEEHFKGSLTHLSE